MLLTQFDETRRAVINPDQTMTPVEYFPDALVPIFSHQLFAAVLNFLDGKQIAESHDVDGIWPVYEVNYNGKRFAFYKARLGAPAADYIDVNKKYIPEFKSVCDQFGYPHVEGITWTTDAFFRETPKKIEDRKAMGAVCVEMECAAMQALCDFREAEFFQFLYAGDNLDHSSWDPWSLSGTARLDDKQKIALLAFELAAAITE
jgi:nucleoside phosphorylase